MVYKSSMNGPFSIAMLVYWRVIYFNVREYITHTISYGHIIDGTLQKMLATLWNIDHNTPYSSVTQSGGRHVYLIDTCIARPWWHGDISYPRGLVQWFNLKKKKTYPDIFSWTCSSTAPYLTLTRTTCFFWMNTQRWRQQTNDVGICRLVCRITDFIHRSLCLGNS